MSDEEKEREPDDEREWPDPRPDPEHEPAEPWAKKDEEKED